MQTQTAAPASLSGLDASARNRYAKCIESLQAHPLGHRPRRDPRPQVRLRQDVPARRA